MADYFFTVPELTDLGFESQGLVDEMLFKYEVFQMVVFGQTIEVCNEFDKVENEGKQFFCFNDLETDIKFRKEDLKNLINCLKKMSKP